MYYKQNNVGKQVPSSDVCISFNTPLQPEPNLRNEKNKILVDDFDSAEDSQEE